MKKTKLEVRKQSTRKKYNSLVPLGASAINSGSQTMKFRAKLQKNGIKLSSSDALSHKCCNKLRWLIFSYWYLLLKVVNMFKKYTK